jgi:hypothetical protein
MMNQIFIAVQTLALSCFLEMALCRSGLHFWHFINHYCIHLQGEMTNHPMAFVDTYSTYTAFGQWVRDSTKTKKVSLLGGTSCSWSLFVTLPVGYGLTSQLWMCAINTGKIANIQTGHLLNTSQFTTTANLPSFALQMGTPIISKMSVA